jgi:hypothetical protein
MSFSSMLAEVHRQPLYCHVTAGLWRRCLSIRSQFCDAVVQSGLLTWEQMLSAACRYCVGATRKGGVIFWQIDHEGRIHDGKVMYYQIDCHRYKDKEHRPTWISAILRRRDPFPDAPHETSHCFFGLHLLSTADFTDSTDLAAQPENNLFNPINLWSKKIIVVVEAEKTAFVLSERYPQYIWLAAGGLGEVQPDKFRPLRGRRVIMIPDTDPDGTAFRRWNEAAQAVMQSVFWEDSPPIHVSSFLELNATTDQKRRKIDLLDYVMENL